MMHPPPCIRHMQRSLGDLCQAYIITCTLPWPTKSIVTESKSDVG